MDAVEEDEEINFLQLSREFDELMRGASLRCIWIDLSDGENEEHVNPDAVFSWMKSDVEFYGTSTQKEFDLTLGDESEDFGKPLLQSLLLPSHDLQSPPRRARFASWRPSSPS